MRIRYAAYAAAPVIREAVLRSRVGAGSHTHASLANHSCSIWQIGQKDLAKNTGLELKRAGSAS